MKHRKRFATFVTLAAMLFAPSTNLDAQEYVSSVGGSGYQQSWSAPSLTPYIAISVAAIAGIVIMALRQQHGHGHSH